MQCKFLAYLCIIPLLLHSFENTTPSTPKEIAKQTIRTTLPINPLTGLPSLSTTDLCVYGAQPLTLSRHYIPPNVAAATYNDYNDENQFYRKLYTNYRGWTLLPHITLKVNSLIHAAYITDQGGVRLHFDLTTGALQTPHTGMTNFACN